MKRVISLFLVFSILTLSGNLFAKEKKGVDLIIQRTDGTQARGELIAVKEKSLLILERESGADVTIDVGDIKRIILIKKSKFLQGAGLGVLIGGGAGAGLASLFVKWYSPWALFGVIVIGGFGAALGLLIGGIAGGSAGIDETIKFDGKSDSEIQKILE